jgi:hypothetical protein
MNYRDPHRYRTGAAIEDMIRDRAETWLALRHDVHQPVVSFEEDTFLHLNGDESPCVRIYLFGGGSYVHEGTLLSLIEELDSSGVGP